MGWKPWIPMKYFACCTELHVACAKYQITIITAYSAVLDRNRIFFCCVFWSHYHIQSAVAQNFHPEQRSYILCRHVRYRASMQCVSPTLNWSSALQHFEHGDMIEMHDGIKLPETATYEGYHHKCISYRRRDFSKSFLLYDAVYTTIQLCFKIPFICPVLIKCLVV